MTTSHEFIHDSFTLSHKLLENKVKQLYEAYPKVDKKAQKRIQRYHSYWQTYLSATGQEDTLKK